MHSESGLKSFPVTRWSLVERAADTDPEARRNALDALLRLYLPALRAHLRIARRFHAADADDLLQGFVADRVVENGIIGRADVARGRFRSYLLVALDRYVVSQGRRDRAAKRGLGLSDGAPPDAVEAVAAEGEPSDAFETAWARELVGEAKRRMQTNCREAGRNDVWEVFARHVEPRAGDRDGSADGDSAAGPPADRKKQANLLVTAKRAFRRAVRSVVADYVDNDEQVDEEIRDLKRALACAGA